MASCGYTDPCRSLPPPTLDQIRVAESGAEVEVDVAGGECELVDGAWYFEQDSSHRSGSHSTYRTPGQPSRTVPKTSTAAPKPTTPKKSLAPQKPSQTAKK